MLASATPIVRPCPTQSVLCLFLLLHHKQTQVEGGDPTEFVLREVRLRCPPGNLAQGLVFVTPHRPDFDRSAAWRGCGCACLPVRVLASLPTFA